MGFWVRQTPYQSWRTPPRADPSAGLALPHGPVAPNLAPPSPPLRAPGDPQTPRAKAGGKQSSKDASGKYARSAGSALRRYNEAALSRDVAELMAEWRPIVEGADV